MWLCDCVPCSMVKAKLIGSENEPRETTLNWPAFKSQIMQKSIPSHINKMVGFLTSSLRDQRYTAEGDSKGCCLWVVQVVTFLSVLIMSRKWKTDSPESRLSTQIESSEKMSWNSTRTACATAMKRSDISTSTFVSLVVTLCPWWRFSDICTLYLDASSLSRTSRHLRLSLSIWWAAPSYSTSHSGKVSRQKPQWAISTDCSPPRSKTRAPNLMKEAL